MCIRDRFGEESYTTGTGINPDFETDLLRLDYTSLTTPNTCLLYTSDAADERSSVDLGGRRINKKKQKKKIGW